jgi:hypothetical protein
MDQRLVTPRDGVPWRNMSRKDVKQRRREWKRGEERKRSEYEEEEEEEGTKANRSERERRGERKNE